MLVLVVKTYMKYRSIRKIKQIDIWGGKNEVLGFVVAFVASTRGSPVPYDTEALGPLRVMEITSTRYGDVNGMIHIL